MNILGKGVVIAESQAGVQLITEFSKEVDIDTLFDQILEEQTPRVSFRETLTKKLRELTTKNARRAHDR